MSRVLTVLIVCAGSALGAVAALTFDSLAPNALAEDAPLTLAPLAIADLPLMAETISPR